MIMIENLSYAYDETAALENISLKINKGELISLVGSNGAGKTTLIKCIIGLLKPGSGVITVSNLTLPDDYISYKKRIGYVPESPNLYKYLTGREYLEFIADVFQIEKKEKENQITKLSSFFELSDKLDEIILTYSHGMVKKVSLIGAMLPSPHVLILDEPLIGLDPHNSYKLKLKLNSLKKRGCTILFSSHILEIVEKISDKIAVIDKGKLIFYGTIDDLKIKTKSNTNLEELFMKITGENTMDEFDDN